MSQIHAINSRQRLSGFSLLELMVTLSVLAVISVIAAPSFTNFFDKRRVIDAAEDMYSNLQMARTEAITRNKAVHVYYNMAANTWQYAVSESTACVPSQSDVTQANACYLIVDDGDGITTQVTDRVMHRYTNTDYQNVSLAGGFLPGPVTFDPIRGTTNVTNANAHFTFTSAGGKKLRIKIGLLGQIRLCSPAGAGYIDGYSSSGCTP